MNADPDPQPCNLHVWIQYVRIQIHNPQVVIPPHPGKNAIYLHRQSTEKIPNTPLHPKSILPAELTIFPGLDIDLAGLAPSAGVRGGCLVLQATMKQ